MYARALKALGAKEGLDLGLTTGLQGLYLQHLVSKEVISYIDFFGAEYFGQNGNNLIENEMVLAAILMALSRLGHICLIINDLTISPSLEILTADLEEQQNLEKR